MPCGIRRLHSRVAIGIIAIVCSLVLVVSEGQTNSNSNSNSNSNTNNKTNQRTNVDKSRNTELLDWLFPDYERLRDAWESYPLLSTVYPPQYPEAVAANTPRPKENQNDSSCSAKQCNNNSTLSNIPSKDLPTLSAPTHLQSRRQQFSSLFQPGNIDTLLSNDPTLIHGVDYSMIRKVILPSGDEANGRIPKDRLSTNEVLEAFSRGGFSLVFNNLQDRWRPVQHLVQKLEEEVLCSTTSVNMYFTPGATGVPQRPDDDGKHSSGFEAHWDWMDVMVFQISGEKLWSVANTPIVPLSNRDLKRKPTLEEMERYRGNLASEGPVEPRFRDVLLRPGDVLYIPRGFIHNASTVSSDILLPGIQDRESGRPSLHLTFGLEHSCKSLMQSVLHEMIQMFGMEYPTLGIALRKRKCRGAGAAELINVGWLDVLHYSLAEVTRGHCELANDNDNDDEPRGAACWLRKSIPWHPFTPERDNNDATTTMQTYYTKSVAGYQQEATLERTLRLLSTLQSNQELLNEFCIPEYIAEAQIPRMPLCPENMSVTPQQTTRFEELVTQFVGFASQVSLLEVVQSLQTKLDEKRTARFQHQNRMISHLER